MDVRVSFQLTDDTHAGARATETWEQTVDCATAPLAEQEFRIGAIGHLTRIEGIGEEGGTPIAHLYRVDVRSQLDHGSWADYSARLNRGGWHRHYRSTAP